MHEKEPKSILNINYSESLFDGISFESIGIVKNYAGLLILVWNNAVIIIYPCNSVQVLGGIFLTIRQKDAG